MLLAVLCRPHGAPTIRGEDQVIFGLADKLEVPTGGEAHRVEYVS